MTAPIKPPSLVELVMSSDFDVDHFVSEALRSHSEPSAVVAQLESCEDRLKEISKSKAKELHGYLKNKDDLLTRAEAELLVIRETVAGLRASAEKCLKKNVEPYKMITSKTLLLEKAFAVSSLLRRSIRFSSELKRLRLIFQDSTTSSESAISTLSPDSCFKLSKAIVSVSNESTGMDVITIFKPQLLDIERIKQTILSRFKKSLRIASKEGNYYGIVESLKVLQVFGESDKEVDSIVEAISSETMSGFSIKGGFMVDKVDKFLTALNSAAPVVVNASVQVALLECASSLPMCQLFWDNVGNALSASYGKIKKHATSADIRRISDSIKAISDASRDYLQRIEGLIDGAFLQPEKLFADNLLKFLA